MGFDGYIFHPIYDLNVYRVKVLQIIHNLKGTRVGRLLAEIIWDERFKTKKRKEKVFKPFILKNVDSLIKQNLVQLEEGVYNLTEHGEKFCNDWNLEVLINKAFTSKDSSIVFYKKKENMRDIPVKKEEIEVKGEIDPGPKIIEDEFIEDEEDEIEVLEEFEENILEVFDTGYETDFNFGTCQCGHIIREMDNGNFPKFCPRCENLLTKTSFKKFERND